MRVVSQSIVTIVFFCLLSSLFCSESRAISIDNLALDKTKAAGQQVVLPSDRQIVSAVGPVNVTSSTVANAQQVIGRSRFVQVQVLGGFNVTQAIDGGFLSHSQDANTKGTSFVVWDGNPAAGIQPTGLGGVNLLSDGATGFKIVVEAYDFATAQPIKIHITIYDASDPTGTKKVSTGSITLNAAISSTETKIIPFSSFVKLDTAQSAADLKNVGAITMLIDGAQSVAHDIVLSSIGTNGKCDHVPQNGFILDQCGVCNGNNSTCADCEGLPNGPKKAGTFCSTGELGSCGDGTLLGKFPSCSCSRSKPPTGEVCDGVDNDCDGSIDEGAPSVGPLVDTCGVCNGNGSTCADCKGVPKGTAKVDICGVCGGDDTSCLVCNTVDISEVQQRLDGGAKEQEQIIIRAAGILRGLPVGKREAKFISVTLQKAHKFQIRNWVLAYSLPGFTSSCSHTVAACVSTSNVDILEEYRKHNLDLKNLSLAVLNKIRRAKQGRLNKRDKRLFELTEKQFSANLELSKTVPDTQVSCAGAVVTK
jgi:hypothetical protein